MGRDIGAGDHRWPNRPSVDGGVGHRGERTAAASWHWAVAAHVAGIRESASRLRVSDLFAPVRPFAKSEAPLDPWLRTHARLGARIVKVCPTSMTIPGTLAQWRKWTGLPFASSGDIEVPGALVPVHVDVDQDYAVYVEPNVWMHHRL